jgi:drug/metabolite transporter (DMT)-like permease
MALLPEFFVLLGIAIFLATSILSAFLDEDVPAILRYIFQAAAIAGLGILLISTTGSRTSLTEFWIGIVYLSSATASEVGVNVYLAFVRRQAELSMTLSGIATLPLLAITATVVSSYLAPGGDVSLSPTTVMILVFAAVGVCLSLSGFFRDAVKHILRGGTVSPSQSPLPIPLTRPVLRPPSPFARDDEWEESPGERKTGE